MSQFCRIISRIQIIIEVYMQLFFYVYCFEGGPISQLKLR